MSQPMIIDTDCHIQEPADLWTSRLSKNKYGNLIPHVKRHKGRDMWFIGDEPFFDAIVSCVFPDEERGEPVHRLPKDMSQPFGTYDTIHPSAYDARERIQWMDKEGIKASTIFPNFDLFTNGAKNLSGKAAELRLDIVKAYNDFLLEWVSPDPSRFITLACTPYWNLEAAVEEIQRCADLGYQGIMMTCAPQNQGLPYLADSHWDPLWAVTQDAGLPIHFHAGNGDISHHVTPERLALESFPQAMARYSTSTILENAIQLGELITSGVPARYPSLKFVMVESGIGWIPFVLESLDWHYKDALRAGAERPFDLLPSEYFARQIYANYWFEKLDTWHIERLGMNNILFETDFPHPTCLVGDDLHAAIENGFSNVSENVREHILWKNAAELYNLKIS